MNGRTISEAEAHDLLSRQESHFWDFKSARSNGKTLQKAGAGLANSDGGELLIGVEDPRKASGLDRWQGYETIEDANIVLEAMARDVQPPVPYTIEYLQLAKSRERGWACLVTISKSPDVHFVASGGVFIRRGTSTVELTGQAVTDLTLAKGAATYENQLLSSYLVGDLVGEPELACFLESYSPRTEPEDFSHKQRLFDRETGQARVAAAILYAASPPAVVPKRCGVKVARYNTKLDTPTREHLAGTPKTIEGPARLLIEETLAEVSALVESVSALQPDGSFLPLRYPPEALKEIIVNAIIHRDYNISDDVLVHVFDNRVEVRSPGVLPGHMTLDNLFTERFSRNPTVVRLLNKYPDPPNKDIGEGLRTVREKMMEARLKEPTFEIEGSYFVVRLAHTPLARPHEIVMEYLETHSEISNSIARSLTGITSENSMKDVFYALRNAGKIEMVPGRRGSRSAWRKKSEGGPASDPAQLILDVASEASKASTAAPEQTRGRARSRSKRQGRGPGRNEPCPCGSGRKFKRCCLGAPGIQPDDQGIA